MSLRKSVLEIVATNKGGQGSGNFNHQGQGNGKVGGSSSSNSPMSLEDAASELKRLGVREILFESSNKPALEESLDEMVSQVKAFTDIFGVKPDVRIVMKDPYDNTSATFDVLRDTITIHGKDGETIGHELGHRLDWLINLKTHSGNGLGFQSDKDAQGTVKDIVDAMSQTDEHRWWKLKDGIKKEDYLASPTEMFARAIEQYAYTKSAAYRKSVDQNFNEEDKKYFFSIQAWVKSPAFEEKIVPLIDRLISEKLVKGGVGSGNHGHKGRIGEVGGSTSNDAIDDLPTIEDVTKSAYDLEAYFTSEYEKASKRISRYVESRHDVASQIKKNIMLNIATRYTEDDLDMRAVARECVRSSLTVRSVQNYPMTLKSLQAFVQSEKTPMANLSDLADNKDDIAQQYYQRQYAERKKMIDEAQKAIDRMLSWKLDNPIIAKNPEVRHESMFGDTNNELAASFVLDTWAKSSTDSNPFSLALQKAAEQEFGLTEPSNHYRTDNLSKNPDGITESEYKRLTSNAQFMNGLRKILRAQYDDTQKALSDMDAKEVTVWRGIKDTGKVLGKDQVLTPAQVKTNPLSSFSISPDVASSFTSEKLGAIIISKIPANDILSLSTTGIGCYNEREVVVLGRPHSSYVYAWENTPPIMMVNGSSALAHQIHSKIPSRQTSS